MAFWFEYICSCGGAAESPGSTVPRPQQMRSVSPQNNTDGVHELAFGGLIYCLGVVFFKSDGVIPFAHAIWHVFVALAAAVHYYAIWKYLYRSSSGSEVAHVVEL